MRRNPFVAAGLNMILFGTGHLYLGRAARFLWPAVTLLLTFLGLGAVGALSTFTGITTYFVLVFTLWLFGVGDAIVTGFRTKEFIPTWYSRWYVYLCWPLALNFLLFPAIEAIREPMLGYRVVRFDSSNMSPIINFRELFLVDTRAFRTRPPNVGELVVTRPPSSVTVYVKRVSSLPVPDDFAIDADQYYIVTDFDRADDFPEEEKAQPVPIADVIGRVTYVLWSHDSNRIGKAIK